MPDTTTATDPTAEPLDLRLLRDIFDERGIPLACRRRQCRRNRHCSGAAQRPERPLTPGESLPPCAEQAKAEARLKLQTITDQLRPHLAPSAEPRQWPDDEQAAGELRFALAQIHRIHARPGRHPEHERIALAAWAATDPDPQVSALYDRVWRLGKLKKHPPASTGTAP